MAEIYCLAGLIAEFRIIDLLLDAGANLDARDTTSPGGTPLHRAAANGIVEAVVRLLERGAMIESQRADNSTSLHRAAFNGHIKVIELLLEKGANPTTLTKEGKTPADVAIGNKKEEAAKFINEFIQKKQAEAQPLS